MRAWLLFVGLLIGGEGVAETYLLPPPPPASMQPGAENWAQPGTGRSANPMPEPYAPRKMLPMPECPVVVDLKRDAPSDILLNATFETYFARAEEALRGRLHAAFFSEEEPAGPQRRLRTAARERYAHISGVLTVDRNGKIQNVELASRHFPSEFANPLVQAMRTASPIPRPPRSLFDAAGDTARVKFLLQFR